MRKPKVRPGDTVCWHEDDEERQGTVWCDGPVISGSGTLWVTPHEPLETDAYAALCLKWDRWARFIKPEDGKPWGGNWEAGWTVNHTMTRAAAYAARSRREIQQIA